MEANTLLFIVVFLFVLLLVIVYEVVRQAREIDSLWTILSETEFDIENLRQELRGLPQGGGGSKS